MSAVLGSSDSQAAVPPPAWSSQLFGATAAVYRRPHPHGAAVAQRCAPVEARITVQPAMLPSSAAEGSAAEEEGATPKLKLSGTGLHRSNAITACVQKSHQCFWRQCRRMQWPWHSVHKSLTQLCNGIRCCVASQHAWIDTCSTVYSWPERPELASLVQTWALTAWAKRRCCCSCCTCVGVVRLALQQAHQRGIAALQE